MELRKLISFGKTSYVISLPKTWVEKNKLHKGDILALEEKRGELNITANNKKEKQESKELTLQIDDKDFFEIRRLIISSYIDGFNSIAIIGKSLKNRMNEIKDIVHNLMALEIVEETSNKLVIKDFINIHKINIWELLRKMDIIIRGMIADSKKFLQDSHISAKNISQRDEDVNRLYHLLLRIVKLAISNPSVAKSHKLSELQLLALWQIISDMEKIGDEVTDVAKYLERARTKPPEKEKFEFFFSKAEETYLKMMKGFFLRDKTLVVNLASKKEEIIAEGDELLKKMHGVPWLPSAIEKTKNIILLTNDIGRGLSETLL